VRAEGDGGIALPVSTTRLAAELAANHGRQVHGSKLSASAIMRAAQHEGVVFAGAEGGGYVFPMLHPAYDGMLSFGKLLELLAAHDTTLGRAVDALPEPAIVRRRVPTPWERKGAVMRQLVEAAKGQRVDDTDGIKVFHPAKPDGPGGSPGGAGPGGSGGPPGWSPGASGPEGDSRPWDDDLGAGHPGHRRSRHPPVGRGRRPGGRRGPGRRVRGAGPPGRRAGVSELSELSRVRRDGLARRPLGP
jgi:hypothetical protein